MGCAIWWMLKPCLHQQQRRSNIRLCCEKNGNNVERICRKILSFSQSRNKMNMFNLFWLCRKDEISFNIVANNGNIVEATFDFVERIVRYVALNRVASILLLVRTGLYGVKAWCDWLHGAVMCLLAACRGSNYMLTRAIGWPQFALQHHCMALAGQLPLHAIVECGWSRLSSAV